MSLFRLLLLTSCVWAVRKSHTPDGDSARDDDYSPSRDSTIQEDQPVDIFTPDQDSEGDSSFMARGARVVIRPSSNGNTVTATKKDNKRKPDQSLEAVSGETVKQKKANTGKPSSQRVLQQPRIYNL